MYIARNLETTDEMPIEELTFNLYMQKHVGYILCARIVQKLII